MKIREGYIDYDDENIVLTNTFDPNPTLQYADDLRQAEAEKMGDSNLIGVIPGWLVDEWMKNAGVKSNDTAARQEVLKRNLMSGEFGSFRVWDGSF